MAEEENASTGVQTDPDANSVVAVVPAHFTPPKRSLVAAKRRCALLSCRRHFLPVPSKAPHSFHGSDAFCSPKCRRHFVSSHSQVEERKQGSVRAVYGRVKRQVAALKALSASSIFAAHVPAAHGNLGSIVVAAQNADQATITQFLLLGHSNPADVAWAAPIQSMYAASIRSGHREGFERVFVDFMSKKVLRPQRSAKKATRSLENVDDSHSPTRADALADANDTAGRRESVDGGADADVDMTLQVCCVWRSATLVRCEESDADTLPLSLSRSGLSEQRTKAVGHVNAGDDSSSEGSESEYVAGVAKVSAAGRPGQVGPSTRGT